MRGMHYRCRWVNNSAKGYRWRFWRSAPDEARLSVSWAWPRRFPTVVVAEPHDHDEKGP